jgi:hypothetical protein
MLSEKLSPFKKEEKMIKWCPNENCGRILPEEFNGNKCPDCNGRLYESKSVVLVKEAIAWKKRSVLNGRFQTGET